MQENIKHAIDAKKCEQDVKRKDEQIIYNIKLGKCCYYISMGTRFMQWIWVKI